MTTVLPLKEGEVNCLHPNLSSQNGQKYCKSCGETIFSFHQDDSTFFDDASTPLTEKKSSRSIRKELDLLKLADEVKDLANQYYMERVGDQTFRSDVRQEMKFICIFDAYRALKIEKDPQQVATLLGLKRKGMSRGILRSSLLLLNKERKEGNKGKQDKVNTEADTTALATLALVPDFLDANQINYDQSHLEDIERIYHFAKDRSSLLNRSKPQSIASALVYFYMRHKFEVKPNKSDFAKKCSVSPMTVSKIDQELEVLLNSEE